jgi:hypothetical protein
MEFFGIFSMWKILYDMTKYSMPMRQYTQKHVMIVKFFVVGTGLNGNKSMNITNVYSPKQNQYTSHGN